MSQTFSILKKYKYSVLAFLMYSVTCIFVMFWVSSQLNQKQQNQWQFQLSGFSKAFVSKTDYIQNLVSGIGSLYRSSDILEPTEILPLINDQISGLPFDTSIEFYYRVNESNKHVIAEFMRKNGAFDFEITDKINEQSNSYVLLSNHPKSEFGHLVGRTLTTENNTKHGFRLFNWPQSDSWSVVSHTSGTKLVALRFNLTSFLDYVHASGNQGKQHILVSLNDEFIYSSDWKRELQLGSQTPLASQALKFFNKEIKIYYYDTSYFGFFAKNSVKALCYSLGTLAILFGLALLLYLITIKRQYHQVNRLVTRKTKSLNAAKQKLINASKMKVTALEQQLETEKKYKNLFINSAEGLFRCDNKGYLLDINPAFNAFKILDVKKDSVCHFMSAQQQREFFARKCLDISQEIVAQNTEGKIFCFLLNGSWCDYEKTQIFEGRLVDITEKKQYEEKLKYQAEHDELTDLLNRQTFLEYLENTLTTNSGTYYLLYIDLDRFKLVNDSYGHKSGDELLRSIANILRRLFSGFGEVARLGGDEFAIYVSQERLDYPIEFLLEQFTATLNRMKSKKQTFRCISASMGLRTISAPCELKPEQLLHEADCAMYHAKQLGRDQFCFFNDNLAIETKRKRQIENLCNGADYLEQIRLVYQPVYCINTQTIIGFEALLRIRTNTMENISPIEFVPVIEEMGKITEVGLHIAKLAAYFCAQINESIAKPLFVNVNVSPKQLKNYELTDWLVSQTIVSRKLLQIEITESAMMEHQSDIVAPLKTISEAGYTLLIDDFGTGYSSLARLRALPLQGLKIDRSFINDLNTIEGLQMVKAIIAIAQSLNLDIVAEGIEEIEQFSTLAELGVDKIQGYLFSKPLEYNDAINILNVDSMSLSA